MTAVLLPLPGAPELVLRDHGTEPLGKQQRLGARLYGEHAFHEQRAAFDVQFGELRKAYAEEFR